MGTLLRKHILSKKDLVQLLDGVTTASKMSRVLSPPSLREKIWNINLIVSVVVVLLTISSLTTQFFSRFHYFSFFVLVKLWCVNIIWSTGASKIIPLFRLHINTTLNENHVVERSVLTGHFVQGEPRKASHHGFLQLNSWSIRFVLRTA